MKIGNKKIKPFRVIMYIFAIIWAMVSLSPLLFAFISSFKDTNQIYGNAFALPESFELTNYITAFETANIGRAIINSFFLATASTILVVTLASLVAFSITRLNLKGKNWVLMYFIMGNKTVTINLNKTIQKCIEV